MSPLRARICFKCVISVLLNVLRIFYRKHSINSFQRPSLVERVASFSSFTGYCLRFTKHKIIVSLKII